MFGDNQSVITSSTRPHSVLAKRHSALAYNRVHEVVASDIVGFHKIDGRKNPADVLSRHFQQAWPLLKPLLYWHGDTAICPPVDSKPKVKVNSVHTKGEYYESNKVKLD